MKTKRIEAGKYRYRGHIIYRSYGKRLWWCCPDPSDSQVVHKTLRASKKYIDEWEQAFKEGRVYGNLIGATEETLMELSGRLHNINRFASMNSYIEELNNIFDSLEQ